jgi:uncharacterized protein (TIGR00369 family)
MTSVDDARLRAAREFCAAVPHNRALGITVIEFAHAMAVFELPYRDEFVGNTDNGVIHGGVITALLDGTAGASVFAALPAFAPIATLDLRIDYLRPATPKRAVRCRATCYHRSRTVAFVRAVAYHDEDAVDGAIAHAVGTFMIHGKRKVPA